MTGSRSPIASSSGLEATIRTYRQEHRCNTLEQLRSFAHEPTLRSAVRRAGLAMRPDGKRYGHQRRLSRRVLSKMRARLLAVNFESCRSFHELYERVEEAIGSIHGVGDLAVYDTALRIGARLRLKPDRVYLHRGTRQGARALGLNWQAPFLDRRELPAELRKVPAWEVEDILCIFKDFFDGATRTVTGCPQLTHQRKRAGASC